MVLRQVKHVIQKIKWENRDIADFLGSYLSEPKPHIFFEPPTKPLSRARFEQMIQNQGIALAPKSQLLCHGNTVFINGIAHVVSKKTYLTLRRLGDTRQLGPLSAPSSEALELLYLCYLDGYISPLADTRKSSRT